MIDLCTLKGSPHPCAQNCPSKYHWRWWDPPGDVMNLGKKQGGSDWDSGRGSADSFGHILFTTFLLCTDYVLGNMLGNADTMVRNTDEVLANTRFMRQLRSGMLTNGCANKGAGKVRYREGATGGLAIGFPVQSTVAGIRWAGVSRELQDKNRQAVGLSHEELRRNDARGPTGEAPGSDVPERGSEVRGTFL